MRIARAYRWTPTDRRFDLLCESDGAVGRHVAPMDRAEGLRN